MIRTDLTDDELLLIRVLRLVEDGGEAHVKVDIRDKDGVLKHNYDTTFGFGFEYCLVEAQRFMAHLREHFPAIVEGKLITYGDQPR